MKSWIALMLMITLCDYARGHDPIHPRGYKLERDLLLVWDGVSSDPTDNQVMVSDGQGHSITQIGVLRLVSEAKRVGITDVTTNKDMVAVAATYQSKEGDKLVRPTAALLLFNMGGEPLSAFALSPSYSISRLTIDDDSNIWTLTDGTEADPSTVPMVVEYTTEGKIIRQVLTRDMFPFHAVDTKSDVVIGSPVMGYSGGVVWFWLPGSTEIVTISPNDGKAVISKTELPKRQGRTEVVLGIARQPSGELVGQFREDDDHLMPDVASEVAHYVWSASTGSWSQFKPTGCETGRLIGANEKGPVYMRVGPNFQTDNLCAPATR